ncbi:MAG TPA: GNAT family N-acetyltransferase, partial [Cyanophyceae cyanobacterium]
MLHNHEIEIEELQTQEEWQEAFPVMRELRCNLDEQAYLDLLSSMVKEGYRLFALRDLGVIVSLAGIAILT